MKELIFGTLNKAVAAFLGLSLTIILANQYSTDEFGEFSIGVSLLNFGIIIAAFGQPRKLARDSSRAFNSNKLNEFSKYLTRILKTNFIYSAISCSALAIVLLTVEEYTGWSDTRTLLLVLMIISIPLISLNFVLSEIIKGLGHVIVSIYAWNLLLYFFLIIFIYFNPTSVEYIATYYFSASLITVILAIYFLRRRNIKLTFSGARIGIFPTFNKETKNFFITDILREVKRWGIIIIVFPFLDASSVGIILISKQVANVIMLIPYGLNSVLINKITKLFLIKDFNQIQRTLNLSVTLLSIVSFTTFVVLFLFHEYIINLFNSAYISYQLTFLIICFSPVISNVYGPLDVILNLCDKEEYVKKANYISTASLIVLGIAGSFFLDSLGCAIAILVSVLFHNLYIGSAIKKQLSIVPKFEFSSLRSIRALY